MSVKMSENHLVMFYDSADLKKIFRNTSLKQLITPFLMICLLSLETGNFYK